MTEIRPIAFRRAKTPRAKNASNNVTKRPIIHIDKSWSLEMRLGAYAMVVCVVIIPNIFNRIHANDPCQHNIALLETIHLF
jgi:hypothetical protein